MIEAELDLRPKEMAKVKVLIVGEAYGAREALFEHPFVGASGQELGKMLFEAGLLPQAPVTYASELEMIAFWRKAQAQHGIAIANVFNARPPDNDITLFFGGAKDDVAKHLPAYGRGKWVRTELAHHVENLWQTVRDTEPNLVIAFGNTACWALLQEIKISALRGTIKPSPHLGVKVLPTYHPAAVLRQWNLRPIVVTDLEKAATEAQFKEVRRIERWLTINPTLDEIAEWSQRPADYYAVDIENPKVMIGASPSYLHGQIAMIGFARSPHDALVIPFFDADRPGGSYWSTPREEVQAVKLADALLKRPVPKIFQNGIYDLTHLLRRGYRPTMCREDTMLLHHALYPEMLKGLGFLGSIYSSEIAWKTMSGKGNNLKRDE
jgi:DNA polymerase